MYHNIPFRRIIENKNIYSYPDYLNEEISLLSIDKNYSQLIGSASYRIAKYPSDYDIFEQVTVCCSEKELVDFFITNIRRIINNILNKKYHWFLELKCGTDPRFKFQLTYSNGYFNMSKEFYDTMNLYYSLNLINQEEINEITRIYKMYNAGQLEYEQISKIIRDHYILRWNSSEVKSGIKKINGISIKLEDAIKDISQINIEILAILNDKVTDLSNFFVLVYKDVSGKMHAINLPIGSYDDFYNFFIENLKKSIEKVGLSILDFNPLKLVKRYWSYGKFIKDPNLLSKLSPILNSDAAYLGQLRSELGTISKLIEKVKSYPKEIVINQISNLKWKLSTILLFGDNELSNISLELENINKMIKDNISKQDILNKIDLVVDIISPIIDNTILHDLKRILLFPPPIDMLPINKTY